MKRATPSLISRFVRLWNRVVLASLYWQPPRRDELESRFIAWWKRQNFLDTPPPLPDNRQPCTTS